MTGDELNALEPAKVFFGLMFSVFVGGIVIWYLIERLAWPYVSSSPGVDDRPTRTLSRPLGGLERLSFTIAVLLGAPTWIGVWLAVKVASQWSRWSQDGSRQTFNVFLIGNLLSILFGVGGAWIAAGRLLPLGS